MDTRAAQPVLGGFAAVGTERITSLSTYTAFGFACQLPSGRLALICREGASHVDTSGAIVMRTTTDGGATWSGPSVVYDSIHDDRNVSGGITPDGRLIVFLCRLKANGASDRGFVTSDDEGRMWSAFKLHPAVQSTSYNTVYGGMVAIGNGRLMQPWHVEATGGATTFEVHVAFSDDGGTSWGGDVTVYSGPNDTSETSFAYLGSGDIVGISRHGPFGSFWQYVSRDNGITWTNLGLANFDESDHRTASPWLQVIRQDRGSPLVACYFGERTHGFIRCSVADAGAVLTSATVWSASTPVSPHISDILAYPTVVHKDGDPSGYGVYFSEIDPYHTRIHTLRTNVDRKLGIGVGFPSARLDVHDVTSSATVACFSRGTQAEDPQIVTTFGHPVVKIGGQEYGADGLETVGLGYTSANYPEPAAEIGFKTTSLSGGGKGALVFATRDAPAGPATERVRIDANGNVGIGVVPDVSAGPGLHVASGTLRLGLSAPVPSSSYPGKPGEMRCDGAFVYHCYAPNLWRRIPIPTEVW